VDIELLVIDGCPNSDVAARLLRQGLDDIGLAGVPFSTRVVDSDEQAVRIGFTGSPSFVVDGADLFPGPVVAGVACRVYEGEQGRQGVPPIRELRAALKRAADVAARAQ
jgi:hypothetical protein